MASGFNKFKIKNGEDKMKKFHPKKAIVFIFFLILLTISLFPQSSPRFFDRADSASKELRLTILHPSIGSIQSLLELRKKHLIPSENLLIIGVYHEKEFTKYEKSIEFVKENHLDWIKFHKLSAKLEKDKIFDKNSLSTEFEKIFKKSDGIIFFGGADIPPYIYNEKTNLLTHIQTPYRHFLELSFIFHLLGGSQNKNFSAFLQSEPQFPVLGICLGCQSLNVGTGGTLIQDIFSEIYGKMYLEDVIALGQEKWHTNPYARLYPEKKFLPYNMHPIRLEEKSKFVTELGFKLQDTPYVISAHHQMVDKLGKGIKIAATSLDGKVVEAIEHQKYPNVLGLQFHPEFPILWDQTKKFRITPKDKKEISLFSILKNNPPSLAFHKKIWAWFFKKLEAYHKNKKARWSTHSES